MTQAVLNWLWNIGSRDLCALVGISFVAASGIAWTIQIPGNRNRALNNIADAIRRKGD